MKISTNLYTQPSALPVSDFTDILANGIIDFSTENNVVFSTLRITVDTNKFLLTDNLYEENFPGMNSGIVYLQNIRRVYMVEESYKANNGHYQEALSTYGKILPRTGVSVQLRGAMLFSEYYTQAAYLSKIEESSKSVQFPGSPIVLDGIVDAQLNSITFDNNFKQEYGTFGFKEQVEQSQCITVRRTKGRFKLTDLIVKNQNGIEVDKLVGVSKPLIVKVPYYGRTTDTKEIINKAVLPKYNIDDGSMHPILVFQSPSATIGENFKNDMMYVEIENAEITNMTLYENDSENSLFCSFHEDLRNVTLKNLTFHDIEMPLSYKGIILVKAKEHFKIDGMTAYNINTATSAKSLETGVNYLSLTAAVLNFDTFSAINSTTTYTVNSLIVYHTFSQESAAVRITPLATTLNPQIMSISFTGLNITNTTTTSKGCFYIASNVHVSITDSYFTYNKALNETKDIYLSSFLSFTLTSTVFLGDADVDGYVKSITLVNANTVIPVMDTITFLCNPGEDNDFNSTEYERILETEGFDTIQSPIVLQSSKLITRNSVFKNCRNSDRGGVISLNYDSTYQDEGSTFAYNLATYGGAVNVEKSKIKLQDTTFFRNYASQSGAVHLASESEALSWTNATFSTNYAQSEGGALSVLSSSNLVISDSTFAQNTAQLTSVIYALGTLDNNTISNCTFQSNASAESQTLSFAFANLLMRDCRFSNNIVYLQTAGIFMTFSTAEITGTSFDNSMFSDLTTLVERVSSTRLTGGFIFISVNVVMILESCTFSLGYAYQGGAIYVSGTSDIVVTSCTFTSNIASTNGGDIYLANYEAATFTNNTFAYTSCPNGALSIYSNSGILIMRDNTITIYKQYERLIISSAIYLVTTNFNCDSLEVTYPDQQFLADFSITGGGIYAEYSDYFIVTNSKFENLHHAVAGGAIYIYQDMSLSSDQSPTRIIRNTVFTNNKASAGGAIYSHRTVGLVIDNCTFTSNKALNDTRDLTRSGNGGVVYFYSASTVADEPIDSSLNFTTTSVMENNSAELSGGAIYWNYDEPVGLDNLSFINNTATLYGNDKACFSQNMEMSAATRRRYLTTGTTISGQRSGSSLPTITVYLKDKFGQVVGSDSSSTATISVTSTTSGAAYTPVLSGSTTQIAKNGVFVFSGITFTAEPGKSYSVSFTTDAIDSSIPSNQDYLSTISSTSTSLGFNISLRA